MRMHGRKLLLGIQEILSLARAAARLFKPGATECRSSERSSTERLRTALARSLDDGTAEGRHQKEQFLRLTSLVCASLRSRHHVQTVSLHEAYRGHDPSEMAASAEDRASAAAFSESLHWSVMSAGFTLCSREDELRALHGHFGDEEMWNVPVVMDWKAIDSSLVSAAEGGFDAYAAEEAHGRAVTRPSWASKLTVYHRGTGVIEKRGYFVGAKIEELTTRKLRALGAAAVRLGRAAVSPLVDGLGRPLAGLVERRVERLLERSVLLRDLTRKLSPPPSSEVRDRISEVRDRRDGDGMGGGPYAKAGLLYWEDDLRLERQAPKDGLALTNLAGLALTNLAGLGVARRMPLGRRIFRVRVAREKHADPPTVFDCSTAYLRWGLTRRIE